MSKKVFISGGSRGIGKAIALAFARKGFHVAVAAKTAEPHPKLPGTVYSAVEEINAAGGTGLPIITDIREEEQVIAAIEKAASEFGGLDIVINNASAINLSPSEMLPMKRYDLMHDINVRGTFMVSKYAIPHLKKSDAAHILTLSPPISLKPKWFAQHTAYTMAKYGMSMTVMGLAEELKPLRIAVNALWPQTLIATAAVKNLLGGEAMMRQSRKPEIMGDAAVAVCEKSWEDCNGQFLIDEDILREQGMDNFDQYAFEPGQELLQDLFLD